MAIFNVTLKVDDTWTFKGIEATDEESAIEQAIARLGENNTLEEYAYAYDAEEVHE